MSKKSDLEWCEKDQYHRHCWERVGVTQYHNSRAVEYYRCSQCKKYKRLGIDYVIGGKNND